MSLGLSHSLSRFVPSNIFGFWIPSFTYRLCRFKLKFSPDKVDTMVVQAIALLDDLDKEINIYCMRVKVSAKFTSNSAYLFIYFVGMVRLAFP